MLDSQYTYPQPNLRNARSINDLLSVSEPEGEYSIDRDIPFGCPRLPKNIELREYQKQAIDNWFKHRGRGTLKMATGAGKTIVALALATRLYRQIDLQVVIIVCPFQHLVKQWGREGENFNLDPILAYESVHRWQADFAHQLGRINYGQLSFLTIVTTIDTFTRDSFQSQLKYLPDRTLIIGDEVHNFGSHQRPTSLPRNIGLRLGLSATPERHFDEVGTQAIFDYFGEILEPEFTLQQAIACGALVPYLYYPMFVELTAVESERYLHLTKIITRKLSYQNSDRPYNYNDLDRGDITPLLMQRSRIVSNAENKIPALRELMRHRLQTSHTLFYCGDGGSDSNRQLNAVTYLLGQELGYRINTYTAATNIDDRERLRQQFESGELQGLVAIRCLDEGIDIPAIRHGVILASTTNPRQFIQRRGRILRPHPGKEIATLFDTIVLPPQLDRQTMAIEKQLLKKELDRYLEFANIAANATAACKTLLTIRDRYRLMD